MSESPDALGICGGGAEVIDGGEDALVIIEAYVLALTYSGYMIAADGCHHKDLIAGDVQAAFGVQAAT